MKWRNGYGTKNAKFARIGRYFGAMARKSLLVYCVPRARVENQSNGLSRPHPGKIVTFSPLAGLKI
jgi:hypothetical protein